MNKLENRTEMFTREDIDTSKKHYENEIVVIGENSLHEEFRTPQNQIWFAVSGFGCDPEKMGTAVFAKCLGDGENAESERWRRGSFIGVLKYEVANELGFCPSCGGNLEYGIGGNALSRKGDYEICSDCGTKEAMEEFENNFK